MTRKKKASDDDRTELTGLRVLFMPNEAEGKFTHEVRGIDSEEHFLEVAMVTLNQALTGYCAEAFDGILDAKHLSFSQLATEIETAMDFKFTSETIKRNPPTGTRH